MEKIALFISDMPGGREFKLATGLKEIGWKVVLLCVNAPRFTDFAPFHQVVNMSGFSRQDLVDQVGQLSPDICHVFCYYNYSIAHLFITAQRSFPVVIDPYDQIFGMFTDEAIAEFGFTDRVTLELFCHQHADGICCRHLETQLIKRRLGMKLPSRALIFDGCLPAQESTRPAGRPAEEIHIVHSGSVCIEKLHPDQNEGLLWMARKIAQSGMHFHIYPSSLVYGDFESDFSEYRDLERELGGKFHLHYPVPFDDLTRELSQYDLGLITSPPEKGGLFHTRTAEKLRLSMGNKLFDYIEAGLPIITNESFAFLTMCASQFGMALSPDPIFFSQRPEFDFPAYQRARQGVARARRCFDATRQATRLSDFYQKTIEARRKQQGQATAVATAVAPAVAPPAAPRSAAAPRTTPVPAPSGAPVALSWAAVMERPCVKLYAGNVPAMPQYEGWIGLSIDEGNERHLFHDITVPFPIPDNSVDAFQAEDVLEHIPYEKLPAVLNEIFRVLKPGGHFRLSVPDYGCDILQNRSLRDASGAILYDPEGGGTRENPGHLWFPRIDSVSSLVGRSLFSRYGSVDYLHFYNMDGSFVSKPVDYAKGHVDRSPDFDARVKSPYRPMSLIVDLFKTGAVAEIPSFDLQAKLRGEGRMKKVGTQEKDRCIFVNTYYDGFIDDFYGKNPAALNAPYQEQKDRLRAQFFGDSDFYSGGLIQAGWDADDLIINAEPLQQAWARENGCDLSGFALVVEQIKRLRPSCVYLQNLGLGTTEFLAAIRPYTELIVGQIAYPLPGQTDLSGFDIIISSFPHYVERLNAAGITAYYQPLAFDARVLKGVTKFPYAKRPIDCSFVGGISLAHGKGYHLLEHLAAQLPIDFWGYGAETLPADSRIKPRHHGEVWGSEMFYLMGACKVTVNRHIDVAENNANNMRLFEATGCGALLITDLKDNLHELFEIGKEVVAYRSPEECVELVRYYLEHPEEAERIARAGQARTLRDHAYTLRMQQTAQILSRHLESLRDEQSLAAPQLVSNGRR